MMKKKSREKNQNKTKIIYVDFKKEYNKVSHC
jgi:hypothetical protein